MPRLSTQLPSQHLNNSPGFHRLPERNSRFQNLVQLLWCDHEKSIMTTARPPVDILAFSFDIALET